MDWLQALWLALIQGLTEFLPISSSAHLILPSQLLGWPDQGLAFDVAVHLGTLTAVCLYYRRDLLAMTRGSLAGVAQRRMNPDMRLALLVVWATLPAIAAGLLFKDWIEGQGRSALIIAVTTVLFAVLLLWADIAGSRRRELSQLGWRGALLVGLAQALALIPGTSRSGITITAALMLGFRRTEAANLSFLMSIPVILGAAVLKLGDLLSSSAPVEWGQLLLGFVVSAVVAYLTIVFFIRLLERLGMWPFVAYRLLLGTALFWLVT
jgi:undecaprenyl-diphosphatase